MNDDLYLSFDVSESGPSYVLERITLIRATGETIHLDPQRSQVNITKELPQIDRMQEDLGAICEVFRETAYYYASVSGFALSVGDQIILKYQDMPSLVIYKVIEIENGRARVEPPIYRS